MGTQFRCCSQQRCGPPWGRIWEWRREPACSFSGETLKFVMQATSLARVIGFFCSSREGLLGNKFRWINMALNFEYEFHERLAYDVSGNKCIKCFFVFCFISKERAKLDCINHFSWMALYHGFGLSVFSYEFACPMHFGPYVSGYNEGIFVHLKFIQQVFIECQLVTLFYSSFFQVWKNGMVF